MAEKASPKVLKNQSRAKGTTKPSIGTREQKAKKNFLDVTALIRSIQRTEGNPDCFGRVEGNCAQMDCAWRTYCLEGQPTSKGD